MLLIEQAKQTINHLKPNEWAALEEIIAQVHKQYGDDLLRVVLFGSKARGDFDEESDLDLLIVVRMEDEDYWRHWKEIVDMSWKIEFDFDLVFTLIIKDEKDYMRMTNWNLLLNRNINHDGIELWTLKQSVPLPL